MTRYGVPFLDADVRDVDDVRMADADAPCPRRTNRSHCSALRDDARVQRLDRDALLHPSCMPLVHGAHAALAEQPTMR